MVIPDGFGQANLLFDGIAAPTGAQVTFGFETDPLEGDPAVIAGTINTVLAGGTWDNMWSSSVTYRGALVKLGPNETGPSATVSADIDGGYGSGDVSPQCTFLIHKTTAFGGRAGRGRMYWPGVPLAEVDQSGVIAGATLTAWQAALTDFFEDLGTAGINPVLLHGEGSPITTPTPILAWNLDGKIATQRRRLRR